jgi:septal ring-binding cell division protein DamX
MALGVVIGFVLAHVVGAPSSGPAVAATPAPAKAPAPGVAPSGAAISAATIPLAATATTRAAALQQTAAATGAAKDPSRSITSRIAAGRELLADESTPRFAVQLMVADARERDYVENYLSEAGRAVRAERLFVVPAGSPEAPRLGVLIGAFDERGEALSTLASLPESLRQFRPYVRSLEGVREDARRAERR